MGSCNYSHNSFLNYFDENRLISLITGFTFVVIFIFIYILNAYTFFDKLRIPRAADPSAPFGNIKDVLFQKTTLYTYLWKYYNKFKRKGIRYGGLYLFFKPSVLIVDPVLMQKILKNERCVRNVNGKHLRNSKVIDLFKDDKLENFLNKYNEIKDDLLMDLNDKCLSTILHDFLIETTSLSFGFKINLDVLPALNWLLNKNTRSNFRYYFDLVYPLFQKNTNLTQEMQIIIKDIIHHRKKNDLRENDLIQSFIDLINESDYEFNEMTLEIFNIFVDNFIYSYSTILFCLYEMASNKDIQQNLVQEIRSFSQQSINLKDLQHLPYLDAVVKETLRKYPTVPTIIKKCGTNFKTERPNLELPKGTFILYSIMGIHHDALNYLEPEKFNPDRFLEECKTYEISHKYIPFGFDMWKNIGLIDFTTLHIKLGIIGVFSSYSVSFSKKYSLEFDNKKVPVYPKEPLPIIFEPLIKS